MTVGILCKIAALSNSESDDENALTISHRGKTYEPIIKWNPNYKADISQHSDFCLVALNCDGTDYLTIFRDSTRKQGKDRASRLNVLSICFPEFEATAKTLGDVNSNSNLKQATNINDVTDKLYGLLKNSHLEDNPEENSAPSLTIDGLQVELRPYQSKTIQWMVRREKEPRTMDNFYRKITSKEGYECFVNLVTLDICDKEPKPLDIPFGGILAEEMGLGKTIEILALIILNPRILCPIEQNEEPKEKKRRTDTFKDSKDIKFLCVCTSTKLKNLIQCTECLQSQHQDCMRSYIDFPYYESGDYICPNCWESKETLIPTAATVIVSPNSIKLQWLYEIEKHTKPQLRALLYEGAAKHMVSPKELASYDVVLTDYCILRSDLYFTNSNESNMNRRRPPKKMRVNCPLVLVDWWRVCLDEAQMESSKSRASLLVKKLPTTYRWAVTGTPIQSSLDDLLTLLDFIGFHEVSAPAFLQQIIAEFNRDKPENLVKVLQQVMRRTCKIDVAEEIGLPPQSDMTHIIELNNIEKLFYSDEHATCMRAFNRKIKGYSDLKGITTKVMNLILQPMLKLRQDCSIPVLCVKLKQENVKKFLQPQELLDHLKSTNENECKHKLRSMASLYNGMAALYFIKKNYNEAIKNYENVLKLAKTYSEPLNVDSLLQIHALFNAVEAYRNINAKDTPKITEYEEKCNQLEWKYLQTYATNLQAAEVAYASAFSALDEKKPTNSTKVWDRILQEFVKDKSVEHLLGKINDEVFLLHSSSQYERFESVNTVLFLLDIWYQKIIKIRQQLASKVKSFDYFLKNVRLRNDVPIATWRMMNDFFKSVTDCHLELEPIKKKPDKKKNAAVKTICQLCEMEKMLKTYECLIFDKTLDEKTSLAEGTWNPTFQETVAKSILSAVKWNKTIKKFGPECDLQHEIISLMKAEYKAISKLWIEMEYTVKAYDELSMCKMRTSLVDNKEKKTNFTVYENEIDEVLEDSKAQFNAEQRQFVVKHARLKYIRHLEENSDPGPCPICHLEEQTKYVVLECGHNLCFYCLKTISELNKATKLTCSVCRHEQKFSNIHYVTRTIDTKERFQIKGDYSTKVSKICLEVKRLKHFEKDVKIIIFAHWLPVLKAISDCLKENDISFIIYTTAKCVQKFKNEKLGITCLLMLLKTRSQGLNLTEATHVFLAEPILNPGEELQAIGRVHRIGQNRPTFVHRFIVKNTIEENIFNTVSRDKTTELTVESMKKLFDVQIYDS